MAIDPREFRRVLGHFAAGVTVVTTRGADGAPHGLTVTAFASVSLVPPLVLVCIDTGAESHPHFRAAGVFAVNFLADGQQEVSRRFALSGGDKFAGSAWRPGVTGAPVLAGTLGHVECRTVQAVAAGDHTIFVGEVEAAAADGDRPLLYFRGGYHTLRRP